MSGDLGFKRYLPTLLSEVELRDELTKRGVKRKALRMMPKNELLDIFLCHFMPLPQRVFPDNYHGKLINQMIRREKLKSKKHCEASTSKLQLGFGKDQSGPQSNSRQSNRSAVSSLPSNDRLKPPISSSEVASKKIQLTKGSSSTTTSSISNLVIKRQATDVKDNTEIETRPKTDSKRSLLDTKKSQSDSPPSKKARQRIAWP